MSTSSGAAIVFVTAGNPEQANLIAHALVGERLAACVNIVSPIKSVYRWQDNVQEDVEHLLLIKTRSNLVARITNRVKELHSYELPEVIAIPIADGSKPYLEWLLDSATSPPAARALEKVARKKVRRK